MKVIGICGPSCSGKSSLANALKEELNCDSISVDFFYSFETPKTYVKHEGEEIRSFERPEHYDGERVAKIIKEIRENKIAEVKRLPHETSKKFIEETLEEKPFLIIEGFQILNYPSLVEQINISFYVDIPFEESIKRRVQRYNRGAKDDDYVKIGKSEWERMGLNQKEKANFIIDGTKKINQLKKEVLEKL